MCDQVAERVALGESLGELAEHVESCTSCRGLVAMSSKLGAVHHAVDPGLGFTARMTVGAQHRLVVRRRRRVALGLAATVATGAFGVFVVTRGDPAPPVALRMPQQPQPPPEQPEQPVSAGEDDLAALVQLADVDRARRVSARWSDIKKPLAPYKALLKGVTP
ncbi:MAG TPA: hypothetical protein VFK02_34890 [Kofleriaceae bacterium]|nr:hypothetical protein [Kofleriaceae bacterium]